MYKLKGIFIVTIVALMALMVMFPQEIEATPTPCLKPAEEGECCCRLPVLPAYAYCAAGLTCTRLHGGKCSRNHTISLMDGNPLTDCPVLGMATSKMC